jgi:hypothetical protein
MLRQELTSEEAHIVAQVIEDWLDADEHGLHRAFPDWAAHLESALEKLAPSIQTDEEYDERDGHA